MIIPFIDYTQSANTNLNPLLYQPNQPVELNGVTNAWKVGSLVKDVGYERVSTQLQSGKNIGGLFHFIQEPGTEKVLVTVDDATSDDTQLFYKTPAGAWTEVAAAETQWANYAGINVEMESFIKYAFIVGYGATDGYLPVGTLNGTTFGYVGDGSETNISDGSSTANVTMPKAKYIKRYRDRLYLANCNTGSAEPYRVYYSSVPSAGAISWNRTTQFFDVDYSDEITGMIENWDRLLIFTKFKTYMYDQSQRKKLWDYGCANHRTIKNSGPYTIWCGYDGVWMSTGGQPQNISGPVVDFIRNGNPENFFAEVVDETYYLYVGNVTVDETIYANCVLTFDIPISSWKWRELYNTMTIFGKYLVSGQQRLYMGSSTGEVWNKGKHTDSTILSEDAIISGVGQPIGANFTLAPINLTDFANWKRAKQVISYAERAQGLQLQMRVLDKNSRALTPFKPVGQLKDFINKFDINVNKGVLIQFAGSEYSRNPYFEFHGFALDVELDGRTPNTRK